VSFPLQARVILHGLVKAPHLNGMIGIIRSRLSDGRHRVYFEGTATTVAIKPGNLKLYDTPLRPASKMCCLWPLWRKD
jgi:autotransporter translocation and assembly factor TamB